VRYRDPRTLPYRQHKEVQAPSWGSRKFGENIDSSVRFLVKACLG
jgi:hypothetical protein